MSGLPLAVAFQRALSGSPHRSLDRLLPTFRGSKRSSNIVLCTNTAEVVCQGRHLACAQHTGVGGRVTSAPTIYAPPKVNSKAHWRLQLERKNYDMPKGAPILRWRLY